MKFYSLLFSSRNILKDLLKVHVQLRIREGFSRDLVPTFTMRDVAISERHLRAIKLGNLGRWCAAHLGNNIQNVQVILAAGCASIRLALTNIAMNLLVSSTCVYFHTLRRCVSHASGEINAERLANLSFEAKRRRGTRCVKTCGIKRFPFSS